MQTMKYFYLYNPNSYGNCLRLQSLDMEKNFQISIFISPFDKARIYFTMVRPSGQQTLHMKILLMILQLFE